MARFARALPALQSMAAVAAGCLLVPMPAGARQLQGTLALTSQLVDRGLAITSQTPVMQGAVSWATDSGWSLALAGGVELQSPDHLAAAVARLARSWTLSGNWRMQAGVLYYHYEGKRRANAYEAGVYWEYRDVLSFGLSGAHYVGSAGDKLFPAADLTFHWPLTGNLWLTGGVGVARYAAPYGSSGYHHLGYYRYGQAGLLWSHGAWRVGVNRVYVDPESREYLRGWVASPWLATISHRF